MHGLLSGPGIVHTEKRLKDLGGLFADQDAFLKADPDTLVYRVQSLQPVEEGTEGGLFFGATVIEPGLVGREYFMTRGHFHAKSDRGEFYWTIEGEGMLIFMDRQRRTWAEKMTPGSLHYIPAETAHRTANTGESRLTIGACWPSDAGHDYRSIASGGFSARLLSIEGSPRLIS